MPCFYSWMLHSAVKLQKHSVDEETSKVDHGESILMTFSNISWWTINLNSSTAGPFQLSLSSLCAWGELGGFQPTGGHPVWPLTHSEGGGSEQRAQVEWTLCFLAAALLITGTETASSWAAWVSSPLVPDCSDVMKSVSLAEVIMTAWLRFLI